MEHSFWDVASISWHAWFTWSTWTHGSVFSAAHHVLGTWSSWCMSAVVASYTDCWQVEYCSLHGTASIFLALWVTDNPQGQTMDASNSTIDWLFHTLSFLILNVSSHFALKTAVWPMFVLDSFGVCELLWNIPSGMLQVYLGMHGSHSRCGRMAVYSQQPTMCWAPGHHGVCPQWWRPIQTAGKLSTAPCTALLPYSWPCGLLIIHKGKPWTHQIPRLTGFFILCPS